MSFNRRDVLKILPAAAAANLTHQALANAAPSSIHIEPSGKDSYLPLETIKVRGASRGTITVLDGDGEEYLRARAQDPFVFKVGASLGLQKVVAKGINGVPTAETTFNVDCATEIDDEGGLYRSLMDSVLWTIMSWNNDAPANVIRYKSRTYQLLVNWMFDHTLTMKGMKYYSRKILHHDTKPARFIVEAPTIHGPWFLTPYHQWNFVPFPQGMLPASRSRSQSMCRFGAFNIGRQP